MGHTGAPNEHSLGQDCKAFSEFIWALRGKSGGREPHKGPDSPARHEEIAVEVTLLHLKGAETAGSREMVFWFGFVFISFHGFVLLCCLFTLIFSRDLPKGAPVWWGEWTLQFRGPVCASVPKLTQPCSADTVHLDVDLVREILRAVCVPEETLE